MLINYNLNLTIHQFTGNDGEYTLRTVLDPGLCPQVGMSSREDDKWMEVYKAPNKTTVIMESQNMA